jgi:anion-transporting  ArsA/GET3 family ATPase
MDTVALLFKVEEISREKKYEYVQIHFPSYEKMLDFVMLPLNGEWYYQISLPGIMNMLKLAKLVRSFIKMPEPDLILSKINEYHSKLEKIEKILTNVDTTSARFDINPRHHSAGKTFFAYLSLFGINVDGVFTTKDFDFASKRFILKEFSDQAYEKPKNIEELASKAKEVFDDPAEIFRKSKPVRFDRNTLEIQLGYGKASDMSVYQSKNQLAIRYKKLKRTLILPESLKGKNVENAKFSEGNFTITFS